VNDSLDRELERLLRVEPPPDFLPRLHARIEREPARRVWRSTGRLIWVSGAAAAAAAVLILVRTGPAATSLPPAPAAPAWVLAAGPETPLPPEVAEAPSVRQLQAARPAAAPPASAARSIEIIISESEALALHRLFVNASRGLAPAVVGPADGVVTVTAGSLEELQIPVITIEPLDNAAQ
jgi:hypothetical protein